MKYNKLFFLATCCFSTVLNAQEFLRNDHSSSLIYAYDNATNTVVRETKQWPDMSFATNVSFVSSNIRFEKANVPAIDMQKTWRASGWKGEKVYTQILVWTNENIQNLTIEVHDLVNEKGARLDKKNISAGFIKYVMTDEFADGCGHRKSTDFDSSLVADVIDIIPAIPVVQNTVQPVWVSIHIPAKSQPGSYKGSITVNAGKSFPLDISLTVQEHVLPSPSDWKFDLDLWQHPAAIARVHNLPLWSKEHFTAMKPYYTMLAEAGQKCITASIIHEPWNHQTYDDFPSLIRWIKKNDGSWKYDYSLFDKYISFVMDCGITKRINCYTMIPWELSFRYYDETLRRDTVLKAKPGSKEYNSFWSEMLTDFAQHLKTKGWFDKTSISMDERPMKDMQAVISLLKSVDPGWKITMAGEYHPEIEKDIFDYSIASKWSYSDTVLQQRLAAGKPSTFYTCCVEKFPNGFTFSPPAEHVWIGWFAAAKGFTGYLRWAYNSWTKDPLIDSRFRSWPAGDTYQVYPGPRTSVRFEKMIEGIQDFEKLRILKQKWTREGNTASLQTLNELMKLFTLESLQHKPASEAVEKAKQILNSMN